jgi:sulfate transport system ATP-binding protein
MSFVGPVTRLGGRLVRPHDLVLLRHPEAGATPATVVRVARLGFEVRVDVRTADGEEVWVQLARGAEGVGIEAGTRVFVKWPDDAGLSVAAGG